ncbi:MAG TPA: ATP-dependent protease ATPase subunit HslU [Fervidobacterium sp.]|nr:ATP-dependent protease ATPase subunit HslU [Thermotogaceae bacterium]HOV53415.1 ATP-dependent protease ATPase subunit HslU [Fervidobacterium sp.]HPC24007.1 ATP-dependent protease ATPase subunit HslU [Fervidobacterium sp.]HQO05939.1 ATP-dependent protease ATPase subunit HslU [Fervidobacterium sp.]HQQ16877.1 ATP-dependent protease ATPase subunit HslU [Fervidobacterium sp.]
MQEVTNRNFDLLTPKQIVEELDKYIIGQDDAKKAVAIAIRNRIRRQRLSDEWRKEVTPKNILLIGPTGVGKTEIARRLAQLSGSPFLKVEATKFTEVGYVGKNVDSMVRDLVEIAVNMVKQEKIKEVEYKVKDLVNERILDAMLPSGKQSVPFANIFGFQPQQEQHEDQDTKRRRTELREKLKNGELEDMEIELDIEISQPGVGFIGVPDMEDMGIDFSQVLGNMLPKKTKKRRMKISEARRILTPIESEKLIDMDEVIQKALSLAQERGIIFIDELDKIAGGDQTHGPDVSRQGVQRDLLPIIEGTTVTTKYGPVKTDFMLFIGAGAFHMTKPTDLIPELQGRFPIRVELEPLRKEDFVRILTEPENALIKQYKALLYSDGIELDFTPDAIDEIAQTAYQLNEKIENIGARRLYTVVEKLLEDIMFEAPDIEEKKVVIDKSFVNNKLGHITSDENLSSYIL